MFIEWLLPSCMASVVLTTLPRTGSSAGEGLCPLRALGCAMGSEGLRGEAGGGSAHLFSEAPWGRVRARGITGTHGEHCWCQGMFA